jgi:hypothetical protein
MNPGQALPPQMNQGMNQMLELFKMQYVMKFFDGGAQGKGSPASLMTMVLLMGYDQFVKYVPFLFQAIWIWLAFKWNGKKEQDKKEPLLPNLPQPPAQKSIRAFIQFERKPDKAADPRIDAVMSHVCSIPEVTSLRYNGVEMVPNFKNALMIENDVWFEITGGGNSSSSSPSLFSSSSSSSSTTTVEPIIYRLSTYDHDITWLHRFVQNTMERFEQDKKNKLGSEMFYFDQITTGNDSFRSYANRGAPIFTKSRFLSNRNLGNVYLRQIDELKQRVDFFMKRRDWYDSKGIPHTLGIVMYGVPGCGKTSTIKGIANETKRHIFNIALSEIKTKEALKDLFYNEQVFILQDGKAETLSIPLKQRLYVIEDIDAMDSVVIKRSVEQKRREEQERIRVKAELELLKQTQGDAVARSMMSGKSSEDKDKLDLATLLNVLDGVRETPGRIIILSTNYPERLDEALLRPGRFDMMLEFEKHSPEVMRQHLEKHYDTTLTAKQWARIKQPSLDKKWTPAEVSQILFRRIGDMDAAIDDLVNEDPAKVFKFSQMGGGSDNGKTGMDFKTRPCLDEFEEEEPQGTDLSELLATSNESSTNVLVPLKISIKEKDLVDKIRADMEDGDHASDYTGCDDSPGPGEWYGPRRKLTPEEKEERKILYEQRRKEYEEREKRLKKEQKENTIETVLASSMFQDFLKTDTGSEPNDFERILQNYKTSDKFVEEMKTAQKEVLASPMFQTFDGLSASNDDSVCDATCLDEFYEDLDSKL